MKVVTTKQDEIEIRKLLNEQLELMKSREAVRAKVEEVKKLKRQHEMEEREWTTKVMTRSIGRISDITGVSVHVVGRIKRQFDMEQRIKSEAIKKPVQTGGHTGKVLL